MQGALPQPAPGRGRRHAGTTLPHGWMDHSLSGGVRRNLLSGRAPVDGSNTEGGCGTVHPLAFAREGSAAGSLDPVANQRRLEPFLNAYYFLVALALAFCASQRRCCASAIFLRASALKTRFFLVLALAGAFLAVRPALVVAAPSVASSARACCSLDISASISARIFSIAIHQA
jgi:hypothetical protein